MHRARLPPNTALSRLADACLPARTVSEPLALEAALPWLVPKVRPRFAYDTAPLRTGRPAPVFRPLAGIFAVSLAVDTPERTLDLGEATLRRWGADFDLLVQRARGNLLGRGGEEGFLSLGPGVTGPRGATAWTAAACSCPGSCAAWTWTGTRWPSCSTRTPCWWWATGTPGPALGPARRPGIPG